MAQIPRNLPPAAPTIVTSGRLQGGLRTITGADISPVEETGSVGQDGVLFNDSLLRQHENNNENWLNNHRQANQFIDFAGSSQMFASLFEANETVSKTVQINRSKGFTNLVARAIKTYEENVRIIQGTADLRGSKLSITL